MKMLLPPQHNYHFLRPLIVVWLVLVAGRIPEGVEADGGGHPNWHIVTGLLCFSCYGKGCDNPWNKSSLVECPRGTSNCFKSGPPGFMRRGCYDEYSTACHHQAAHTGECGPLYDSNYTEPKKTCINDRPPPIPPTKGGNGFEGGAGQFCTCRGSRCNDGPAEPSGRKCYFCYDKISCEDYDPIIVTCRRGELCFNTTEDGGAMRKGCFGQYSKCFTTDYDGCMKHGKMLKSVDHCVEVNSPSYFDYGRSLQVAGPRRHVNGTTCLCSKDLCNVSAGHLTSSSNQKLIILLICIIAGRSLR